MPSEAPSTPYIAITGPGIQPYSARGGLQQSYEAFGGYIRRNVNGVAVDLTDEAFRLYRSTISCEDVMAPALDGIQQGMVLTVDCAFEFSYLTSGGSASRPVVSGSSRTYESYTFYRPQLTMIVLNYSNTFNVYGARNGWRLDLEETGEVVTA